MKSDEIVRVLSEPLSKPRKKIVPPRYKRESVEKDKEVLLAFLREHRIHSRSDLERVRSRTDPSTYDYRLAFGSWSEALRAAWGVKPEKMAPRDDREYVIKAVIAYNLWTRKSYEQFRQDRPEVLPPLCGVKHFWETYGDLKAEAKLSSVEVNLSLLARLARRLGRVPTLDDCKENDLAIDSLVDCFGDKWAVDRLIRDLLGTGDAGKAGNTGQAG